ncbi:MAG TPA: AMP-binding protein [Acetobacteraceae bacterium]
MDHIAEDYDARLAALWRKHWPPGVPSEPHYPFGEIPLTEYLRRWAATQPDKPAIIFYGAELSFAELDCQSDRFAALLARMGVTRGERIAVFLPSCPQFHIAFFGILKLGCVHVPVNPMFKEHELLYELNDTEAAVILAQDQLMPLVREVAPRTALRRLISTSIAEMLPADPTLPVPPGLDRPAIACPDATDLLPALAGITEPPPAVEVGLDDIAALNYTGGTTGMPKGCVHTQRDMVYTAATACICALEGTERDVMLNFFPVFWIAGEDMGVIFPVFLGATVVEMARWDALGFMAAVQRYRVSITTLLVDNAVTVMEHNDVAQYDLTSLRRTSVSSFVKKLNPGYRARWRELTGATMIEAAWGMTETHTYDSFTLGQQEGDKDLLSQPIFVGRPMPGTAFRIQDFVTGEILPLGAEGEIVVRSPSLLKSYWNKPEATADSIRGGWLHTGDIGVLDEEGFLHFLGRRKEMLKVNGMSVFPAEIEALLGQHPSVTGSGVIGMADEARGQAPVAFVLVSPENPVGEAELAAWCRANMAGYKVPAIRIVEALPMTATGKVKKEELARQLA